MVLINFITDVNDKRLLIDIDKIFKGFGVKYSGGNFKKNIEHYLSFKTENANINIFYGYINNLLLDYSRNNIFIFDKHCFSNSWIPQLNNYDLILVKSEEDKIIDNFIKRETQIIDIYNKNINIYYKSVLNIVSKIKSIKLPDKFNEIENDNLPNVSVCIPTYNRKKFMKLLNLNYNNISYPKDKIELIILDDGDEEIEHLIPKSNNIRYIKLKTKKPIGFKRNECVKLAKNDFICFMDDDDYYPPNSLYNRITQLLNSNKDCVFCSTIGCFHINKMSSIINSSPINIPLEKKVSEATLTFKKSFWHNNKFNNDDNINEGENFIKNSIDKCKEISWMDIIVQLLHTYNTCNKNIDIPEKNGSHFNFTDEEFEIITSI